MKKEKGITLVALIVSIIVLLILATVSVQVLTGDNGLLQKATNAKQENEEAGICENIKLAYGEYQLEQHTGTDKTAEEIIEGSLKSTYGNDNIIKVKVKNEKVTVDMKVNNVPKRYIYKANTGEAYEYVDIIDYKGKEKKNLQPGDDISISTENFRVFYNQDGVIKAMSYYNLKLDSNPIRQATEDEAKNSQEGTISFSSSIYWTQGNDITMTDKNINGTYKNNVQKYIDDYTKMLNNIGGKDIEVRVGKDSEMTSGTMNNPMQTGSFWLGTSATWTDKCVRSVNYIGSVGDQWQDRQSGVRPIIEIPIE